MVDNKIFAFFVDMHIVLSGTLDLEVGFQGCREFLQLNEISLLGGIEFVLMEIPKNVRFDILRAWYGTVPVTLEDVSVLTLRRSQWCLFIL